MSDRRNYRVHRVSDGKGGTKIQAFVISGEEGSRVMTELPHLMLHSPDGFEFGYSGSGPTDLARSIVADWLNTDDPPLTLVLRVRDRFVSKWNGNGPHWVSGHDLNVMGQETF